jgi:AraC-like DNA-binding protein
MLPEKPMPIEAITVLARRTHSGQKDGACRSRPGHLIHLIDAGEYMLTTNGRRYHMTPGDMVYYHECEEVRWGAMGSKVTFSTIGFYAPCLQPPPVTRRKFPSTPRLRKLFDRAIRLGNESADFGRDLRLYGCLLEMLAELPLSRSRPAATDPASALWWRIESELRSRGRYRPSLEDLAGQFRRGVSTISRSCRKATGMSPLQRIRALRMEHARGLLLYSGRNVSETAQELGYGRVCEFSRDLRGWFGVPPTQVTAHTLPVSGKRVRR